MFLPISRIITKEVAEQISREKLTPDEWDKVKESMIDTSIEDTLVGQVEDIITNVVENRFNEQKVLESMVAELNAVSQKYGVSIRLVDVNNLSGKVYYFFPEFPEID